MANSTSIRTWSSVLWLFCLTTGCQHRLDAVANQTGLPGNCMVFGHVLSEAGQPLEGATLELTGPALAGTRVAVTDQAGFYFFSAVPAGYGYCLMLKDQRSIPVRKEHLYLLSGTTLQLPFTADTHGCMVLTSPQPMIDYRSTGITTIVQYNPIIGSYEVNFR